MNLSNRDTYLEYGYALVDGQYFKFREQESRADGMKWKEERTVQFARDTYSAPSGSVE